MLWQIWVSTLAHCFNDKALDLGFSRYKPASADNASDRNPTGLTNKQDAQSWGERGALYARLHLDVPQPLTQNCWISSVCLVAFRILQSLPTTRSSSFFLIYCLLVLWPNSTVPQYTLRLSFEMNASTYLKHGHGDRTAQALTFFCLGVVK